MNRLLLLLSTLMLSNLYSQQVDGGNGHAIILDKEGIVWTVGRNNYGQLGDSSLKDSPVPVQVQRLPKIKSISRGYDHSLAIDSAGQIWAWGRNNYGQLGTFLPLDYWTPQLIRHYRDFVQVEGGHWHSVGLKEDGKVWSWGHNFYGELGSGDREHANVPVKVLRMDGNKEVQLGGIVMIASVGYHTLALDSLGRIWSWGSNDYGQLGHKNNLLQPLAGLIPDLPPMQSVAVGWHHSVALDSSGKVWVWGSEPSGQFREHVSRTYDTPHIMEGLPEITKIACGSWHSLALDTAGTLWGWGKNHYGMLGRGDTISTDYPVMISKGKGLCEIGGGCFQTLAVDQDGNILTCGDNPSGQLGIDNYERQYQLVGMSFPEPHEPYIEPVKKPARAALRAPGTYTEVDKWKRAGKYPLLFLSLGLNGFLLLRLRRKHR